VCDILHTSIMTPPHGSGGAVLIIDPDHSIRQLIATLLQRAGFTVECAPAGEGDGRPERHFDVIVRDISLTPRDREQTLQELASMSPQLLRRTVITTTGPLSLLKRRTISKPFAVLRKPFDIDALVETVRQCLDGRRAAGAEALAPAVASDDGLPGQVSLTRLHRFVRSVPQLRELLAGEAGTIKELLLRHQLRLTALDLAHVLGEASAVERDGMRAAVFRGAARVAAELADAPVAALKPAARDH
jgi:DNA-binding NtrC family response regulator